ncbi:thyroid transcription factor 1-associated protein 26 [Ischnura elegans]|uniref:thyroid transcription factor 1-associated protein 26 n=1 Tax=Ischnura elegans TaxID=197161 RepID=UPI001ED8968A|nr:thyroid transcription factor 1-associated protein 26 [Ischnura elegans]
MANESASKLVPSRKVTNNTTKKPFDKKKWRERQYSKKFKVQQWEERRRKGIIREYIKELKRSKAEASSLPLPTRVNQRTADPAGESSKKFPSAYQLAKQEYDKKQTEKQQRREEAVRRKAEKEEALEKYRKKKMERYKKLSKKTKKGQPVMKDRLEMLLEKIQADCT